MTANGNEHKKIKTGLSRDFLSPAHSNTLKSLGSVSIIGCPFKGGQRRPGVDLGPKYLLDYGLKQQIEKLGWSTSVETIDVDGSEDAEVNTNACKICNVKAIGRTMKNLNDAVYQAISNGNIALTLGGDHSLALGTVSGVNRAYNDTCLLWIDAHGDIHTGNSTPSGNCHGCPVSFLIGEVDPSIEDFAFAEGCIHPSRIAYIGLRDLESEEKAIISKHGIAAYSMHHVDKYGIGRVVDMALDRINPRRDRRLHISFDIDSIDPKVAPGTGTRVRNGLTWREALYICETVAETHCLAAVDLVEVNPEMCENEEEVVQTMEVACSLVRAVLGESLLHDL